MPELLLGRETISVVSPPVPRAAPVRAPTVGTAVVVPSPGPPGPAGASGSGYVFTKTTPATVWTITHPLNRRIVSVEVYSADYSVQWVDFNVQPMDAATVRLSFDDPTSGIALIL